MSDEIKPIEDTETPEPVTTEAAPAQAAAAPATPPPGRTGPPSREGGQREFRPRPRGDRDDREGGFQKHSRFKRKSCRFCANEKIAVDYKDADLLNKFVTDRGKILPRRITGNCAKHQRLISIQIKRARIIAILPFVLK